MATDIAQRTAVVLFNLGGPDSLEDVRPFLFNLFNDPAIIGAPWPLRWGLAQVISRRRAEIARRSYARLGGGSPLRANTERQARALEKAAGGAGEEVRCFIAMRHWRPFAGETAREVGKFDPAQVILLPLYPQYAASTTGSAIRDWRRAAGRAGLDVPTRTVCCYPDEPGLVSAVADMTARAWREARSAGAPRILYSAHGLPEREITRGDPYQWQVERTVAAIAGAVAARLGEEPDWRLSYQSRVGPLKWIGPYMDDEIKQAGREGRPLVVVPVAFVSEHVETLVELDMDYRDLAAAHGVPSYRRVAAVSENSAFIEGLAGLVRRAAGAGPSIECGGDGVCPANWTRCPLAGDRGATHG